MKIAVIACPNGLGHLRRVIAISEFLFRSGYDGKIDIYAPKHQLNHLNSVWDESRRLTERVNVEVKWIDDLTNPNPGIVDVDARIAQEIDFSSYDLVWSDNLLGVLEQRPDAKITGSFFWHEVYEAKGNSSNETLRWIEKSRGLLKQCQPQISGVQYFATPEVRKQKNFFPVGLYRYFGLIGKKQSRSALLSCGLAGEEVANASNALDEIIKKAIRPPEYLYVEPRILPSEYPSWIRAADYSGHMYQNIMVSCIRPGLGTISDSLIGHNKIFSFANAESYEMSFNSKILEKMGLGQGYESAIMAYEAALNFLQDEKKIEEHIIKTLHIRTDGVMATAEFLMS